MPAKGKHEASVILQWQRAWAPRGTYDAPMDIIKTRDGAYGVRVEYAYTMVHKAAATKYLDYVA
jgi:hypothetical protein